ncbi:MAG: pentapeptide repeat-containing protein [Gammaproteobacteria bacterium]|nr:pentapeptide repeat-containing protein [Gammaproteobacteria bacterium]
MKIHDEKSSGNRWYYAQGGKVYGPYPAGLISRYILLGRIRFSDQISSDQKIWVQVAYATDFIPDVMKGNLEDPFERDRLKAARRWADERRGAVSTAVPDGDERREEMEDGVPPAVHISTAAADASRDTTASSLRNRFIFGALLFCAVVAWLVYQSPRSPQIPDIDCNAVAEPMVRWDNCQKRGGQLANISLRKASMENMDLRGADLHHSNLAEASLAFSILDQSHLEGATLTGGNLKGVSLRGAILSEALLQDADLSYADLTGAIIDGADFSNANLGKAKWIDGSLCAPESVGRCLPLTIDRSTR